MISGGIQTFLGDVGVYSQLGPHMLVATWLGSPCSLGASLLLCLAPAACVFDRWYCACKLPVSSGSMDYVKVLHEIDHLVFLGKVFGLAGETSDSISYQSL
jgi:hypothetical protein